MLFIVLTVLVSLYSVQGDGIVGHETNITPDEKHYVQDLISMAKPIDENTSIQKCGKELAVTLTYLCPANARRSQSQSHSQSVSANSRQKRELADECCTKACSVSELLTFCP